MRWTLLACALLLSLCVGFAVSCGCGDDDDDGGGDDDATDDDDDDDDNSTSETWTDFATGMMWQVTPGDYMTWEDAKSYCVNLNLTGYDDWRLPTISELRTLIRGCDGTVTGGSCGVTDSCLDLSCLDESCDSCEYGVGPDNGCYGPSELPRGCAYFWSSSAVEHNDNQAWHVLFNLGEVHNGYNDLASNLARCVR